MSLEEFVTAVKSVPDDVLGWACDVMLAPTTR
jgi:hypothetical protein